MFDEFRSISIRVLRGALLVTVIGATAALGTPVSFAADGDLDTTFSTDGMVQYGVSLSDDRGYGMALGPKGTMYVVGVAGNATDDIAVTRLTSTGALDTLFSSDGKATFHYDWGDDEAWDVAVQSDGKPVVVGSAYLDGIYNFAVLRLSSNGSYDTGFNSTGYNLFHFGPDSFARAVAIQSDGKIVVAGFAEPFNDVDIVVARLNANGTLDTSFGTGGMVTYDADWGSAEAWDVAIQDDGKILVAGWRQADTIKEFVVLRYTSHGTLDTTFNTHGHTGVHFGGDSYGRALAVQDDGKIVVAGTYETGIDKHIAVARFNSNGSIDTGFSKDGMLTFESDFGWAQGWDVAIQPDGKILVAGSCTVESLDYFWLLRYTTIGAIDSSFGTSGYSGTHFGSDSFGRSMAVQTNGKVVVAGFVRPSLGSDAFGVVRWDGFTVVSTDIFSDGFENGTTSEWSSAVP